MNIDDPAERETSMEKCGQPRQRNGRKSRSAPTTAYANPQEALIYATRYSQKFEIVQNYRRQVVGKVIPSFL